MQERSIVVLGGGIAGLSTAWWLAELGARDVTIVEREPALGRQATARSAALLRTASDDVVVEDLSLASARHLLAPPRSLADRPLVERCGLVLLGRGASAPREGWERRVASQPHARALDAKELARVAPHVVHRGEEAWLFPDEGRIDVAELLAALERGVRARGVAVRTSARVVAIERARKRFALVLAHGDRIHGERLVIAAGGWSAELGRLAGARVELTPTRRHLFATLPDARIDPRGPGVWNERTGFYARPEHGGLLTSACDVVEADPERLDHDSVDAAIERAWRAKLADNVRGFDDARLARAWSGTRTFARDERFVIGPDADVEGLAWAAGLGGHGMTASLAAGELCARALLDRSPDARFLRAFAPERLSRTVEHASGA